MFPSEGVQLQMGLSSVWDLLESHTIQLAVRLLVLCVISCKSGTHHYIKALCRGKEQHTGLKTWMSWLLETKWELLAMHVAVSSLSPVSIQIWAENRINMWVEMWRDGLWAFYLILFSSFNRVDMFHCHANLDASVPEQLQRGPDVCL